MDSYEILNVSKDASDKEIEISYQDLKKKYDPNFNTSIRAYSKYREILKAYENIKNDKKRKMYALKSSEEIVNEEEKKYDLFDFFKKDEIKKDEINYDVLEQVEQIQKEDIVVNKKISYLYYLLNLKVEIEYFREVICDECSNFIDCDRCSGLGVVYYKEKQVYCPICHGKGKVSSCKKCSDNGFYKKKENISLFVDNEVVNFSDLGNEYYDLSKSNLIVNFDFYDKENIEVSKDEILVKYYLEKEETLNGLSKEYYGDNSVFKVEVPPLVEDGYKREYVFNGKKIIFEFYNEQINGNDKIYYLFVNSSYKGKEIYFNKDYSNCSFDKNIEFFNETILNEDIKIEQLGYEGKYGGKKGCLVIHCIFNNSKEVTYVENVKVVETSRIFNMLGGNVADVKHFGFKGKNYLLKNKKGYYLLSGQVIKKDKLKNYLLFKFISLFLWLILPCLIFFMPYKKEMFITLFIVLGVYFVLINMLMEVKV